MTRVEFEWDPAKNESNRDKHGFDFELASRVFEDPFQVIWPDDDHSGEQRWKTLGQVEGITLLLVVHVIREFTDEFGPIEVIRIISARCANKHERKDYEDV